MGDSYSLPPAPLPSPRGSSGDDTEDFYDPEPITISRFGDRTTTLGTTTLINGVITTTNTPGAGNGATYPRELFNGEMGFATYSEEPYQDIYGTMRFPGNPVTPNTVTNESSITSPATSLQNAIAGNGGGGGGGIVGGPSNGVGTNNNNNSNNSNNGNNNNNGGGSGGNGRDGGWMTRDYSDFQNCRVLCTLLYDSDDDETPVSYLKNPPIEYKAAILNQIKARGLGYTQGKDGRSIGPVMKVEIKVNVLTSKHEGMNFRVAIELVDDATWAPIQNSRVVVPHIRVISKPEPTHIKRKYVRHKEIPARPNKKQSVDGPSSSSSSSSSSGGGTNCNGITNNSSDDKSLINTNDNICPNLSSVGSGTNNNNNNNPTINTNTNTNVVVVANTNSLNGCNSNSNNNSNNNSNTTCCHCCNAINTSENAVRNSVGENSSNIKSESRVNEERSNSNNSSENNASNNGAILDKSNSSFINETVLALLNKIEAKEDENHRALDNLSATISRSSSLAASYFCSPAPSYVPTTAASPSLQSAITQGTGPSPFALAEAVAAVATSSGGGGGGGSSSSLSQSTPTKINKAALPPKTNETPKSDELSSSSLLSHVTEGTSKQHQQQQNNNNNSSERKDTLSSRPTIFSDMKSEKVANFCGNCEHFLDLYSKLSDSEKEGEIRSYLSSIDLDRKNKLIEFASLVLNNCLVKNDFI